MTSNIRPQPTGAPWPVFAQLSWQPLWWAGMVLLVIVLSASDLRRIGAGMLYLVADQIQATAPTRALTLLHVAQRVAPDEPLIFNKEGAIYATLHQANRAHDRFSSAARDGRVLPPALLSNLGALDPDDENAVAQLSAALAQEPDNATVRLNLGVLLLARADYDAAVRTLTEATRIESRWPLAYAYLSVAHLARGDYDAAQEAADLSLIYDPQQPTAHKTRLAVLHAQQSWVALFMAAEQALTFHPADETARYHRGVALSYLRQPAEALEELRPLFFHTADAELRSRVAAEIHHLLSQSTVAIPQSQ